MWVWNGLLVAIIYLGGYAIVETLTVTTRSLVSSLRAGWQLLTVAAFISMSLPLLIFFTLPPYFAPGILVGSVKG